MKLKPTRFTAAVLALLVILVVCLLNAARFEFLERFERVFYDLRVRAAAQLPQPAATNLGFVFFDDDTIAAINDGSLGFHYGLQWPRHLYGRVLRELSNQGASVVGFDVMFPNLRPDHGGVRVSAKQSPDIETFLAALHPSESPSRDEQDGEGLTLVESDDYFAWQLKRSGIAILAAERQVLPNRLFATNAAGVADISAQLDTDGVLRRARAFREYPRWHPAFLDAEARHFIKLNQARIEPRRIVFRRPAEGDVVITLDAENNFDLVDFYGDKLPPGLPRKAKAFEMERVWHMGLVLAAKALGLDLNSAKVDLAAGQITLSGTNGIRRVLPVDSDGYLLINWELTPSDQRITREAMENLLIQDRERLDGRTDSLTNRWRGKIVVLGSTATGNDLTDHGATPLEKDTFLISKHWNVANSIIMDRFVRRSDLRTELILTVVLGVLTALMTWRMRAFSAAGAVLALALAYVVASFWLFIQHRYWLSLVLPVGGALLVQYVMLVTWRAVFEERERRRTKAIFSKLVAPEIVSELLGAENLSLGGARREVTVLFADVRGFTELTDQAQARAAEFAERNNLSPAETEKHFDEVSRQTLETVNLYLATLADLVKKHGGTFDKYIGDCVMAFWGAPKSNPDHAVACVRMAIEAQRTIHALNDSREKKNQQLEIENRARISAGLPPKPLQPPLTLGTGINTGPVTAGLMGSDEHTFNYTVFGREVNLASRLESVSGRGRIVIGEATFRELQRSDPALAKLCIELEPTQPKGFQKPVRNFEVPWRLGSAR